MAKTIFNSPATNNKLPATHFIQNNLRKKINATNSIIKDLKPSTVLLLTEPYTNKYRRIPSIPKSHKPFISSVGKPRSAIILPLGLHSHSIRLGQFSSPDITTVRITLDSHSLILCSAYMDINLPVDNPIITNLLSFCNLNKLPLLFASDTNARNTLWKDRLTNQRGRSLANLLATFSLHIVNQGSAPTFQSKLGSSLIDLTLVNDFALNIIHNWSSSFEKTTSDHARLTYNIELAPPIITPYRNPKDCDWEAFKSSVSLSLLEHPFGYSPNCDKAYLNKLNKVITDTLNKAYNTACPIKFTSLRSSVPWWTLELTDKRKQVRIMHRKARRHKTDHLWNQYREGQKEFKKLINTSKHNSWKNFTSKISNIPSAARLHKALNNLESRSSQLGTLKKSNGSYTSSPSETLTTLADALLPNDEPPQSSPRSPDSDHESVINKIVTPLRLLKACKGMAPNKSPGPDNVRLSMINAAYEDISPCILHLFKHSLRLGITPDLWHHSHGVVISKPNKDDYTNVRSYRIISLTSSLQKLLEKLLSWYIESDIGLSNLTSDNQHGFKRNFSTDSAIHKITRKIEDALSEGHQALGLFLDIEGAFDNISFEAIKSNLIKSGIPPTVYNWIYHMVSNRTITLTLNGISISRTLTRGCPQGGVLSPFLWNLTLNDLLCNYNLDHSFIQAFADDLAILVGGIDIPTIRSICQRYLTTIDKWCTSIGVKLSVLKTQVIMFTRKRKWSLDKPLRINNVTIDVVQTVKYLGIILDSKLQWRPHIESACNKAIRHVHALRSACCKKWGLKPVYSLWIYNQIIIPSISYGSFVWSHLLTSNASLAKLLDHVQRTALLLTTGAFNTTPSCYLNILSGILPLDLTIQKMAIKTYLRLKIASTWSTGQKTDRIINHAFFLTNYSRNLLPPLSLIDIIPSCPNLNQLFALSIQDRPAAIQSMERLHIEDNWIGYTDGSVKNDCSGSGFALYYQQQLNHENYCHLGRHTTVFQAELHAIISLCSFLSDSSTQSKSIHICIDSKAALMAVTSTPTRSSSVLNTVAALNLLGTSNSVTLHWCPAHSNVQGNELADKLANQGSDTFPIGPEPFTRFSASFVYGNIDSHFRSKHIQQLRSLKSTPDLHIELLSSLLLSNQNVIGFTKDDTRTLTHLFSGFSYLRYFQNKIGNEPSSICKKCNTEEETTSHFLTRCPAFAHFRLITIGVLSCSEAFLSTSVPPTAILRFAISCKYLDFFEPP